MLDQRRRHWAGVVQMLYTCFVFAGIARDLHLCNGWFNFGQHLWRWSNIDPTQGQCFMLVGTLVGNHDISTQCCFNAVPPTTTLNHHQINTGAALHADWRRQSPSLLSRHGTLTQCCFKAGSSSTTLARPKTTLATRLSFAGS